MKINKKFFFDNLTTIFYALIIAIIIRSVLFQPFYIPSSSMEPTFNTPGGTISLRTFIKASVEVEACSEGLITMVFPAASAGAIFQIAISNGEFHAANEVLSNAGSHG